MKKTMSLGDLLNEIAKGTQPKEIKFTCNGEAREYVWSKAFRKYERRDNPMITAISELSANAIVEYEEPILSESEKEYLSAVIKPFRDRAACICKFHYFDSEFEHIAIIMKSGGSLSFPDFESKKYYEGMEQNKSYSLEELGL